MMQIITLVIGPVFVTAALYVMLGDLIHARGAHFSPLKPKLYIAIFCTCDVVALVVQATGAALASHAFDTGGDTSHGAHIVAGGVIFQLVTMLVFATLFLVFLARSGKALKHAPSAPGGGSVAAAERAGSDAPIHLKETSKKGRPWDRRSNDNELDQARLREHDDDQLRTRAPAKHNALVLAMWFSFVAVYVRSIFRAVQLMQGFRGYLATHEKFFIGLDGVVMFLAIAVFNIVPPYILL